MSNWSPQQILQEPGVRMSATEKQTILKKFPPPDENGQIYADGIFEGGGVRGVAFLGALRCCNDLGIRWRKLAGTSAGAITAAVLATDLSMDDLEELLGQLDYGIFLSKKNRRVKHCATKFTLNCNRFLRQSNCPRWRRSINNTLTKKKKTVINKT